MHENLTEHITHRSVQSQKIPLILQVLFKAATEQGGSTQMHQSWKELMINAKYQYNDWGPEQNQEEKGPAMKSPLFPAPTDIPSMLQTLPGTLQGIIRNMICLGKGTAFLLQPH